MNAAVLLAALAALLPALPQRVPHTGDPLMDYRLRSARAERERAERERTVDELDDLATEVAGRVARGAALAPEDVKNVERIRKLARRLRSGLGVVGDPHMENPPATIPALVEALATRGDALGEMIRRSTRYEMNLKAITLLDEIIVLSDALAEAGKRARE
jgi:hypothetical protein